MHERMPAAAAALAANNPAVLLITPRAALGPGVYRVTLRGTGGARAGQSERRDARCGCLIRVHRGARAMMSSTHSMRVALAVRCRCASARWRRACRTVSRRAAGPQMRPMSRQSHRRRLAHHLRRYLCADRAAGCSISIPPVDNWTGQLGPFLRAGGDLRFDASVTQVPHTNSVQEFALEQTRVYLEADVIPEPPARLCR